MTRVEGHRVLELGFRDEGLVLWDLGLRVLSIGVLDLKQGFYHYHVSIAGGHLGGGFT